MIIKLHNIPNYSYEYKVSEVKTTMSDSAIIEDYRLGYNKHLVLTKVDDKVVKAEFNNSKKIVEIPLTWYSIIN